MCCPPPRAPSRIGRVPGVVPGSAPHRRRPARPPQRRRRVRGPVPPADVPAHAPSWRPRWSPRHRCDRVSGGRCSDWHLVPSKCRRGRAQNDNTERRLETARAAHRSACRWSLGSHREAEPHSSRAAQRSDAGWGRPRLTSCVDQATFPPDDYSLRDVRSLAGTHNGYELLRRSPEALHDVVEPILAAVRNGGHPPSGASSPGSTRERRTPTSRRA